MISNKSKRAQLIQLNDHPLPFLLCLGSALILSLVAIISFSSESRLQASLTSSLTQAQFNPNNLAESNLETSGWLTLARRVLAQAGGVVGMSASVEPNPYNTLARQLIDQQARLNQQEQDLNRRAGLISAETFAASLLQQRSTTTLTLIFSILFLLLGVHLYFDHRHKIHDRQIFTKYTPRTI